MTPNRVNYSSRVFYIRDAKSLPVHTREELELCAAVHAAIANHRPGEAPVIIGNSIQLVGIEAILAMRQLEGFPSD